MAEEVQQVKRGPTGDQVAALILMGTLLFGTWLRLNPALQAGFPMNDGGMFVTMIDDLRHNHYLLPAYTSYNHLNIPFVYPPLAFYLTGFLGDVFNIPLETLLLWLPAAFSFATIPAFYLLSNAVLKTRLQAALATAIYTLMPLSMDWFLMGGGLTRGLGQLFLILSCWSACRLFEQPSRKMLAIAILNGSIVVLTHPESALLTLTCAAIIWLFSPRPKQTIWYALLVCLGVAVLISPWLFAVLRAHGAGPFLNAAQTNGSELFLWTRIFTFDFTQEPAPGFVAVLGLIGLVAMLSRRRYLLPLWVIVPFFINPRSSARAAILPLAMLAAICLLDVIIPAMQTFEANVSRKTGNAAAYLFLVYLFMWMVGGAYGLGLRMSVNRLGDADRAAMAWVAQNTAQQARFVVVTGESQLLRDPIQEWFPTLTGRTSQTTLQGREWIWGDRFIRSITTFGDLQSCITQDVGCIELDAQRLGLPFEYLYIRESASLPCSADRACQYNGRILIEELKSSPLYRVVYDRDGVAIARAIRPAP